MVSFISKELEVTRVSTLTDLSVNFFLLFIIVFVPIRPDR